MAILRIDPWDPEYGTSLEFDPMEDLPQAVELDVEQAAVAGVGVAVGTKGGVGVRLRHLHRAISRAGHTGISHPAWRVDVG